MTSRVSWYSGMEVSVADMTFSSIAATANELKSRTHDFFNFGVVNGLTVYTDTTDFKHLVVSSGTAYDPTGERIYVPSNVSQIGYNNTQPNSVVANYTMVARYVEANDGITGIAPDGTVSFIHILDSYSLLLLKTGTDSLGANDVRLAGVGVTVPGGTFIFNANTRDSASAVLGGGTSGGSSGGGGSSTPTARNEQTITATGGQTVFNLSFTYTLGVNALDVYVNMSKQVVGVSYTETSTNSITFTYGLIAGDVVEVVATQGVLPASPVPAHGSTHIQSGTDPIVKPWATVTSGNLSLSPNSNYGVLINKTVGAGTTITLPTNPAVDTTFIVKDMKGDCATNSIVLIGSNTIDGGTLFTLSSNKESITVVFSGSEYSIV